MYIVHVRELLVTLFFSHHAPEQHDHCLLVPIAPGRRLPVCARCLAVYPAAFTVLGLQLAGLLDLAWTDPWGMLLLPLPGAIEFVLEQLGRVRGNNLLRIATGLPLGVGLGRMFARYLHDPADATFWAIVAVYGGTCGLIAAFALRRRFASGSDP